MQIEVEDIRRLNVKPGETLVVRFPRPLTKDQAESMRETFRTHLPDGVRLLLVHGGMEMDVVTAGEKP